MKNPIVLRSGAAGTMQINAETPDSVRERLALGRSDHASLIHPSINMLLVTRCREKRRPGLHFRCIEPILISVQQPNPEDKQG